MKKVRLPGGDLEYAVLSALWELRRASARDVQRTAPPAARLAYTTIATVLDRLRLKGLVSRERVERAFVYRPRVRRETVEQARASQALGWLVGPDPAPVARLVDAVEALDPELVDELAREVARRRKARRGP